MAKLEWDKTGERFFETGVDRGVVYPQTGGKYPKGVAWNGLITVTESPSGAEPTPLYADNIKYISLTSAEEFGFSIEAYMYPDEFAACNGEGELTPGVTAGQQKRTPFGLSYRTIIGNDVDGEAHGYKIHLVYGALAAPSEVSHASTNDSPEAVTMSWECSTTPVTVTGFKPTAHIVIDSTKVDSEKLKKFEETLYGGASTEASLPLPDEVVAALKAGLSGVG